MTTNNKKLTASQKRYIAWKADIERVQALKLELGQEYCSSMYETITSEELANLVNIAKWILHSDAKTQSSNSDILQSITFRSASLAGYSDYTNHSNDSLEQLKALTLEALETRLMQKCNYWSTSGKHFDTIIVTGRSGGWDAACAWSDGSVAFSNIV